MDSDARFQLAASLRKQKRFREAQGVLEDLHRQQPQRLDILASLGDLYWDQCVLEKAIEMFQQATRLAPKSEALSLGLFHTLWESDRKEEALSEMRRFLEFAQSVQYQEILRGILGQEKGTGPFD